MESFAHDGWTFSLVDSGPADATAERTVVLLHGFPQTSAAWDGVRARLNPLGVRTLAPDTRGVAAGARPRGRDDYHIGRLVGDVSALLDAAGLESVHLAGHDWGGGIAWAFAEAHPERVRTLTVLSTPHPAAMTWALRHSLQGVQSWYMLPLQLPMVPEVVLGWGLRRVGLAPLGLPAEQAEAYRRALLAPGALSGAIGPYRGMLARSSARSDRAETRPLSTPTTFVWGNRDAYLGRAAALRTRRHCGGDYRFVEVDADHWLPEKMTDLVADEIRRRVFDDHSGPGEAR